MNVPSGSDGAGDIVAAPIDFQAQSSAPTGRAIRNADIEHDEQDGEARPRKIPRTRGNTACQACRSRKTKCDNQRPTCSYCLRTAKECVYEDEDSIIGYHALAPRLFVAVENLTSLVKSQHEAQMQMLQASTNSFAHTNQYARSLLETPSEDHLKNHQSTPAEHSILSSFTRGSRRQIKGSESLLSWSIFGDTKFPNLFPDDRPEQGVRVMIANLSKAELLRLKDNYLSSVHRFNPILDLVMLDEAFARVIQEGTNQSLSTCLVMLVCALGSLSEWPISHNISAEETQRILARRETLAYEYWFVASQKLSLAIAENTIESIQCLCLAGIWYMNFIQPVQAWKYFSLAGNAWYAFSRLQSLHTAAPQRNIVTIEQSLYFTIFKSECELAIELNIPDSVLSNVNLPYTFPQPPSFESQYLHDRRDHIITEQTWYYYLAEIAVRHLMNDVLRSDVHLDVQAIPTHIHRRIADIDIFETQLQSWYDSLPPSVSFELPRESSAFDPHNSHVVLRMRYLSIRELWFRPFLKLCTENSLDINTHERILAVDFANQCLQYCIYKLQLVTRVVQRHQGTWFGLRQLTTSALTLHAAEKAKLNARLLGAADIVMPSGWRDTLLKAVNAYYHLWHIDTGGVKEMKQILDWILADQAHLRF